MPCRPLLVELANVKGPICRSCLSFLRQKAWQTSAAAYSSQAASKTQSRETRRDNASVAKHPSRPQIERFEQALRELQQGLKADKPGDNFSVRYFEQDGHRRSELADDDAFRDSVGRLDGSELKEALRDIQASLGSREEQDAFQAVLREVGGDVGHVGSARDLERMMKKMENYTRSIDAEIETAGSHLPQNVLNELRRDLDDLSLTENGLRPTSTVPQIPEKPWTANQRRKIKKLNASLAIALRESRRASGLTKSTVSSVYKAYHAARMTLASAPEHVSLDVWDLIWKLLSADESINIHRLAHVSLLSRDMSDARVTLSPSQQLLTIEAIFVDGWESKAIENWKRCVGTLGAESAETFQEYWELGVRMFCRTGDTNQAERAVARLVDAQSQRDARIMMPLIRTYSEQGTPESQERAWTAYRKMRGLLGRDMSLSDYDQVVSYFLTTHQTENALHAFVDMMSDGQLDLRKQKYMPSVVANKFFLGKWLKRLIGAGDLYGAFSVVTYMRQRGVDASPIQLNGLIGAWQRSGGARDLEMADQLAWDMIESRIRFVQSRASNREADGKSWPRATLETFSLVADNYRQRDLHSRMEALWAAFRHAQISPDAFMMNQLLESYILAGRPREALALYQSLVAHGDGGVTPDPYTFSALWKTLAVNRLHTIAPESLPEEIAATRALFSETAKFRSVFEPDGMDGQLARKVLHSFRRLKDGAGFQVALSTLRHVFRFSPPETLVLELVLGTTKLSWDSPAGRKRLILAKRRLDQDLLACTGGDVRMLEDHQNRQDALYEYLRTKVWPGDDEAALREAAKQMGVEHDF